MKNPKPKPASTSPAVRSLEDNPAPLTATANPMKSADQNSASERRATRAVRAEPDLVHAVPGNVGRVSHARRVRPAQDVEPQSIGGRPGFSHQQPVRLDHQLPALRRRAQDPDPRFARLPQAEV